jgi:hypothetical protein
MLPVFLALAQDAIFSRLGRAGPYLFQTKSDPTANWDGPLATMRRATRLHAVIGSLSYVPALLLAIGGGFTISATHFCGLSSSWGGWSSRLWVSVYILFRGVSTTLLMAATFSVFCLWRTYLRTCDESLDMVEAGERCSNIGSTRAFV